MDFDSARELSDHKHLFLDEASLHEHIRISDCTQFTDGASAVVLASEAGLEKLGVAKSRCT